MKCPNIKGGIVGDKLEALDNEKKMQVENGKKQKWGQHGADGDSDQY